jgi:hypothetical protein
MRMHFADSIAKCCGEHMNTILQIKKEQAINYAIGKVTDYEPLGKYFQRLSMQFFLPRAKRGVIQC